MDWKKILKISGIVILSIFSIIGMFGTSILLIYIHSPDTFINNKFFLKLGSNIIGEAYTNFAMEHGNDLRDLAIEMTKECKGEYITTKNNKTKFSFCKDFYCSRIWCSTHEIYENLTDLRYVTTSKYKNLYEPLETYEKGGDCKGTAILNVGLLENLGIEAEVDCNMKENHCLTLAYDEKRPDYKYVIDIAQKKYLYMLKTENHWDYYS